MSTIGEITEKQFFRCSYCRTKFRGEANKKKNNKRYYTYVYIEDEQKVGCIVCSDEKCISKVEKSLKDKTIGCFMCGIHPEDNFNNPNHWDRCIHNEDHNSHEVAILCSNDCKKKRFAQLNKMRRKEDNVTSICANCGEEGKRLMKCGKCQTVLYCGKECQIRTLEKRTQR